MTTRLLIGDVFERMRELPDGSFDLIVTSPPFYGVRSYLPDDHPDKWREIGSEPTVAEYLDKLLLLTANWRRLLAPHGSLAVELGDTYAGSGGAGGDYDEDGLREGQPKFRVDWSKSGLLDKSLCGIPTLYAWSLAYGRNLLTGQESPAGQWRVRNLKPWIRSNPPVGALGDKERPATSYVVVACTGPSRWFDLDAVRTPLADSPGNRYVRKVSKTDALRRPDGSQAVSDDNRITKDYDLAQSGGAPPLDWWHPIDALIDQVIRERSGKTANRRTAKGVDSTDRSSKSADRGGNWGSLPELGETNGSVGPTGKHIRRALEAAGYLIPDGFYDISPKGYAGAHYAVWPPELVRQLIDEMVPRRVCIQCGQPSRRIVGETSYVKSPNAQQARYSTSLDMREGVQLDPMARQWKARGGTGDVVAQRPTLGWSDCGHDNWRPGRVLDPFVGSGTTLMVASDGTADSVGIDLDERNADLCTERVGMFLEVDYPERKAPG